jgi:DNA-binding MarR family transcriptional regulator
MKAMTAEEILTIRRALKGYGVPTKSIAILKAIIINPGITNTELGAATSMTKQAVSKHVNPLEAKGIIGNSHTTPYWKQWEVTNPEVKNLVTLLIK